MGRKLNVRLSDQEWEIVETIKKVMGFRTISDAVKNIIRFARVFFDDRLTIKKAIRPSLLHLLKDEKMWDRVALCDLIKTIPELERELEDSEG